jgi:hypothetical protein
MEKSTGDDRLYLAIIYRIARYQDGQHVSVFAKDADEALIKLEAMYGQGTVHDLHNPDDAEEIRG